MLSKKLKLVNWVHKTSAPIDVFIIFYVKIWRITSLVLMRILGNRGRTTIENRGREEVGGGGAGDWEREKERRRR